MGFCRRWAIAPVLCGCILLFSVNEVTGSEKVRGVNLGGWLVIEGWIKPSLFDGIPNGDMLDGTQVQLKSLLLHKYVCASNGGGADVTVDRDVASSWETFKLWRVSEAEYHFRCYGGQFLTVDTQKSLVSATANSSDLSDIFYIERNGSKVHLKLLSGNYLQATESQLTADYRGVPQWDDNEATFEMLIVSNNLHGDYQLANGLGPDKAKEILMEHRSNFITAEDFGFLSLHGINTVRIPVGWWIAHDPNPPAPFIGGSLAALDRAFSWAQIYGIRCIIDLHAAPGSQNGMEHSASKDGSADWASSSEYISRSLDVIEFLVSRYANHPALFGIELLNEPSVSAVPFDILVSYYMKGYQIIRRYSTTIYVIICQRIGNADPVELYQAKVGTSNIVIDLHYYNLFDSYFDNMSAKENTEFLYKRRQTQLQALNLANGPLVFIGEWVNEWNVTNATQMEYQKFGMAQLDVYDEASFGWCYWTIKNARPHWDFEWNIRNNYLPFGASSNKRVPIHMLTYVSMFLFVMSRSMTIIVRIHQRSLEGELMH